MKSMYIFKNALRNVSKSKGRNILIGIIVFIISFAACVSLSIQAASDDAAREAMEDLKITAQISVDREAMMQGMESREDRQAALEGGQDLTLEELETYAEAESVADFYYTASASLNGESLEPLDMTGTQEDSQEETEESGQNSQEDQMQMPQGMEMPGSQNGQEMGGGRMGTQGDFTLTGYSSDAAMTDFLDGASAITEGEMFAEGTADNTCVINSELSAYNDLAVGDTITLTNPNEESETYTLTICGIYEKESQGDSAFGMMGGFMAGADSSNQIYTSYQTLEGILSQSEEAAVTETDSDTERTTTTALHSMLNGSYAFDSVEDYENFQEEVKDMGLSENYTVSSSDLSSYEESLKPLENLSEYAGYFLLVIMIIGAAILIVLHIFAIRERKYEIGVLAAIGMKKWKIALQFLLESLCVTFLGLLIGAAAGAVSSVPVTNTLLEQQIESSSQDSRNQRFGREMGGFDPGEIPDNIGGSQEEGSQDGQPAGEEEQPKGGSMPVFEEASAYISSISSATDFQVILEMAGIGILLTVVSGCTALIFIMRYDPLRILSNRD